jgi:hypothetical protein
LPFAAKLLVANGPLPSALHVHGTERHGAAREAGAVGVVFAGKIMVITSTNWNITPAIMVIQL